MVAVVTILVLVGVSLLLLRRSTARMERAVEVAHRVGTASWSDHSAQLRSAADGLRDAVAARDPR